MEIKEILKSRFNDNMKRHPHWKWEDFESRLTPSKLKTLEMMEETGGEPAIVDYDEVTTEFIVMDTSPETPKGRLNYCYDQAALDARKKNKPADSAVNVAKQMGIELLSEEEYRYLQSLSPVDTKTSSWLLTPKEIREKGGAIFGDYRYGTVFIYHNGADSYYSSRAFRGKLRV